MSIKLIESEKKQIEQLRKEELEIHMQMSKKSLKYITMQE